MPPQDERQLKLRAAELYQSAMEALSSGNSKEAITNLTLSNFAFPTVMANIQLAKLHFAEKNLEKAKRNVECAEKLCTPEMLEECAELQTMKGKIEQIIVSEREARSKAIASHDLPNMLKSFGLKANRSKINKAGQTAIRMHFVEVNATTTTACSRVGGSPAIPSHMKWPSSNNGTPLHFLCQINFAELNEIAAAPALPSNGILCIFCSRYFDGASDSSEFQAFYFDDVSELELRIAPNNALEEPAIHERAIRFSTEISFPSGLIDNDDYGAFLDAWFGKTWHHLLGHPFLISSTQEDYELPKSKWQFLMQFDSDDQTGLQWGDWGRLFIFIFKNRSNELDFSNIRAFVEE